MAVTKQRSGSGDTSTMVAAICYRRTARGVEFLLVRTSDGARWTFPKGHVKRGENPSQAAVREAAEEAGTVGEVEETPLLQYLYPSDETGAREVRVSSYLLQVEREGRPAEPRREPRWFAPDNAKKKLSERREEQFAEEHRRVVDAALRRLTSLSTPTNP